MTPQSALSLGLALVAALVFSGWIYRRRELPVRGASALSLVRAASLFAVILLLVNPRLPWGGDADAQRDWVLVDASASMSASDASGSSWDRAVDRARSLSGTGSVVAFGSAPRQVSVDSLGADPGDPVTRLRPALELAAEAGAREVTVLSDLRIADAVEAFEVARSLGLGVVAEDVSVPLANVGVQEAAVTRDPDGSTLRFEIALQGEGVSDSVEVQVREEGRLVGSVRVPPPAAGEIRRTEITVPSADGDGDAAGQVRYTATAVSAGDGFALDDERILYLPIDPDRGGLGLLSLSPDWEPRFLLPLLEEVTGLEGRGFLKIGGDRFLRTHAVPGVAATATSAEVAAALGGTELVVVLGVGDSVAGWIDSLALSHPRLLVAPAGATSALRLGVPVGEPVAGEWYVSPTLPSSPVAADLSGVDLSGLPPLTRLLPLRDAPAGFVPFRVQLGGSGPGQAPVILSQSGERRQVVLLAAGFWRWAFRDGAPREAYRRLFAGFAGWLLERESTVVARGVTPDSTVVPAGSSIGLRAPGRAGDSLSVRLSAVGGEVVWEGTVVPDAEAHVSVGPQPPGTYTYEVRAADAAIGSGRIDVDPFGLDALVLPAVVDSLLAASDDGLARRSGVGPRLRTIWPLYLIVLALLCAEWIGRRRQGLR